MPFSSAQPLPSPWVSPDLARSLEASGTTAHRLCSLPGAWVERLGEDLLFNHQTPAHLTHLLWEWKEIASAYPFSSRRIFSRLLPLQNQERTAPVLVEGDPNLPLETVVTESGVSYCLDFAAGYAVGLFLDQRANRLLLRQKPGHRCLNTFAYTCSFSVVAALAGAETFSADLSRKSLNRGRSNFELNALDPEPHRFIADDVLEFLPRLARRKELFDSIILDPPTFSRGNKGRRFRVEDDLPSLLSLALEMAAPQARILLSTNCTKLDPDTLERMAKSCLKAARKQGRFERPPLLPDFSGGTAATTLWIHLQ